LCLDSHAAKCALAFGIPPRLVRRAQHVSNLLSNHAVHELLDEAMIPAEEEDLADAEEVCRRFLAWDKTVGKENGDRRDVRSRLREVLGRKESGEDMEM